MKSRILLFLLLLVLPGCNWRKAENRPLDREAFASLYADLVRTLWKAKRVTADSVALAKIADSVIVASGVTRGRYEMTLAWYNSDPLRWKGLFDEVGKILEERAREEASKH